MTLAIVDATIEIDDVHNATCVLTSLRNCDPEAKVMLLAEWLAKFRVYYVETGRNLSVRD